MWRSFFTDRKWLWWSWGGAFFIFLSLLSQTWIDVKINEWYKGFYDLLQQATERELLMLKIKVETSQRTEIVQICDIFRAKVIDVAAQSVNVEMTGNPNKIKAFLSLVEPYGVIEMARTGAVALKRG